MALAVLRQRVKRLQAELATLRAPTNPTLARLHRDPAAIFPAAGMTPDPWQADLLRSPSLRMLLLCSRQTGKSQTAAALALLEALLRPGSLILILSPSERQSGEIYRDKLLRMYGAIGRPVPATQETQLTMTLANGSRIVALPSKESSVRCYSSVRLLLVDEAARVPDDLYRAIRPMLAVSRGRLIALSTPFGKRGFFYQAWTGNKPWQRVEIKAADCPRITPEFLAEEREELGARWFNQEYMNSFEDLIGAVFSQLDIDAALDPRVKPLALGV